MACSVKSKFLIRCTEPFLGQPLLLLQAHSPCTDLLYSVHHPDLLSLFSVCLPSPASRIHFPEGHVSFPSVFPIPVFGTEQRYLVNACWTNEWKSSHQHHDDAKWKRKMIILAIDHSLWSYGNDPEGWLNILRSSSDTEWANSCYSSGDVVPKCHW